jgi:hypothetical protein
MKIIPRFYHGVMDYLTGILLLAAPSLFGFAVLGGPAAWVPRVAGLMILVQAMSTDYELGVMKMLPIGMHLMTDYVLGALLIASPWLLGFSGVRVATMTVVIMGALVIGLTALTQPRGRPREIMA